MLTDKYISETTGRRVRTYGHTYLELERQLVNANTQPLIVIISASGEVQETIAPYNYTKKMFLNFLDQQKK